MPGKGWKKNKNKKTKAVKVMVLATYWRLQAKLTPLGVKVRVAVPEHQLRFSSSPMVGCSFGVVMGSLCRKGPDSEGGVRVG